MQYVANINRYYVIYKQLGIIQSQRDGIDIPTEVEIDPVQLIFESNRE
ncbi:hypothetical protein JCM19232_1957 [Vibrio ishigakensis]|uniref:Uncharacterized protein n=1 Tax=Vibrio ishigakensis TaxID=1481914 RepID=A0A0B8P7G4_9VIBR|nr:hypothetical protein JCM19232_1957 [Vibrio ishigakensis]